tara:strand:- start:175 stop:660 length:486 start_codon:yes stop_codon:yes gene_type:complete
MIAEKIVAIEEIGIRKSIDIEVNGNHLFFANKILTHNSSTDIGLEDTSESFGLPATADLMFALISTEELEGLGQIMVKQLKNRYNDPTSSKRFVIGIDRAKMKLYDLEESAQDDLVDRMAEKRGKKKFNPNYGEQDDEPSFDKATNGKMKFKKDFESFDYA